MIDFVRAAFRRYFSALLVIIVVIFTVVGTIFGMSARSGSGGVLGFLIGAALGVFTIIVSGGLAFADAGRVGRFDSGGGWRGGGIWFCRGRLPFTPS